MEGKRLTFLPAAQEGARRRAGAAGPRRGRGGAAAPADSCLGPTEASTPRGACRAAWGPGRPRCPESVWGAASAPLLCPRRPEGLEPGGLGSRERASPWEQVLRLTPVSTSLWGSASHSCVDAALCLPCSRGEGADTWRHCARPSAGPGWPLSSHVCAPPAGAPAPLSPHGPAFRGTDAAPALCQARPEVPYPVLDGAGWCPPSRSSGECGSRKLLWPTRWGHWLQPGPWAPVTRAWPATEGPPVFLSPCRE